MNATETPVVPFDALRPHWSKASKVHDWKNYIGEELRSEWNAFTDRQKMMMAANAQLLADREDWD